MSKNVEYYPGTTVRVFDTRLYKDDRTTPPSITMKLATVVRWYGKKSTYSGQTATYPSLIDVVFWHDGRGSKAHFADECYATIISKPSINECINNLPKQQRDLFSFMLWDVFRPGTVCA